MRYLTDDAERSVQERFGAAIQRKHEREVASDLALPLDPDSGSDFDRALANIDMILAAMAAGAANAYWSAVRIAGEASNHMVHELLACDLHQTWVELSDLYEFTEDGSAGEQDVVLAMRQAAREWLDLPRTDPPALQDYFDRWTTARNLTLWRDRLGGPLFNSLDASGAFRWDSA